MGAEIPPLVKHPTSEDLVRWAGASGDFAGIHYDVDVASRAGLPGIIIHGGLKSSWMGQLLTDWIGERGTLLKLATQYRGMDFPGDEVTCKGKVVRKYEESGSHRADLELWIENGRKQRTTRGSATVALPARKR